MRLKAFSKVLVAIMVCAAAAFLFGCDRYEPKSDSSGAAGYYTAKYGEKVSVSEENRLGNYDLFGYNYSGMEYIMSDGTSVVYIDSEGEFRDNRQSAEISAAATAFLQQRLAAIPGAITPVEITGIGYPVYYETYKGEGECWHTRYDGDIAAFLRSERPPFGTPLRACGDSHGDGRFTYSIAYDAAQVSGLEEAYLDLGQYFDLRGFEAAVVDRAAFERQADTITLFDDALKYVLSFKQETSGSWKAVRYKPELVPLFEGATIASDVSFVTVRAGDVSFVAQAEPGFYTCVVSGEPAAYGSDMRYFVHNDSALGIIEVTGLDRFGRGIDPFTHVDYCSFNNGGTYYLGNSADIKPWVEVESVTAETVRFRYHTYFKDQINHITLRVIGMAAKQSGGSYESTAFDSRIVGETEDGWICEVAVRPDAKPNNTFNIQFTYNTDTNVSVQIELPVELPL